MKHSIQFNLGRYQLTINYWFLILFLLIQTGLNELGFWQLSRAQEKQQRINLLKRNDENRTVDLSRLSIDDINRFVRVEEQTLLFDRVNYLVENKIQNGELGYHVLNIVSDLSGDKYFLVNRGWIPGLANRTDLPRVKLPPSKWQLAGRTYPINLQVLSSSAEIENHGKISRLPVMDGHIHSMLEKQLGIKLEPFILRLDQDVKSTFAVDWSWIAMSPEKHLAYAFQWFALALAFLIISIAVLIKKRK